MLHKFVLAIVLNTLFINGLEANSHQEKVGKKKHLKHAYAHDTSYWIGAIQNGEAPISRNGYFGLMDSIGRILIPTKYDLIEEERHGVRVMYKNGKSGLISSQGKVVKEPFAADMIITPGEVIIYQDATNGKHGLLTKKGKLVTKGLYSLIWDANENHFGFIKDGAIGLLDQSGKEVFNRALFGAKAIEKIRKEPKTPLRIEGALRNEAILFTLAEGYFIDLVERKDSVYFGFRNLEGNWAIKPRYDWVDPFKYGVSRVKKEGRYGVIDKQGVWIIEATYQDIAIMDNRHFLVKKNGLWGLVDRKNIPLIPLKYKELVALCGPILGYQEGSYWGLLHRSGKVLQVANYDHVFSTDSSAIAAKVLSERHLPTGLVRGYLDMAGIEMDTLLFAQKNLVKYNVYFEGFARSQAMESIRFSPRFIPDSNAKIEDVRKITNFQIRPPYDFSYSSNYSKVYDQKVMGIGTCDSCRKVEGVEDNLWIFELHNLYGLIDTAGTVMYPAEFERIERISGGLVLYRKVEPPQNPYYAYYEESAVLDLRGKLLIDFKKSMYYREYKGQWRAYNRKTDKRYYIDKKGLTLENQ